MRKITLQLIYHIEQEMTILRLELKDFHRTKAKITSIE